VRIRSDLERKRLAGTELSATRDGGLEQGLYEPQFSRRTYARLLECAESCLNAGVNVIVDAGFLVGAERGLFRDLAVRQGLPFIIVLCEAERGALVQRIEQRQQLRLDPSDADVNVLNWQLRNAEPLSAEERSHVIVADTTEPDATRKACAAIRKRLEH
jgi:predicted kinase